jgi:hypothetical protein
MKKLALILSLMFAVAAHATPPPILTLVTPGGVTVAAYDPSAVYIDANGIAWAISNPFTATPTLAPMDTLRQYYTTANCTGQAYTAVPPNDPRGANGLSVLLEDGSIYTAGGTAIAASSVNSEWNGTSCVAPATIGSTFIVFPATAATTPTIPTGPYHVEAR